MVGIELSQKPRRLQRFRNESSFARSDAEQRPWFLYVCVGHDDCSLGTEGQVIDQGQSQGEGGFTDAKLNWTHMYSSGNVHSGRPRTESSSVQYQHYHLRQRLHNKALIPKTTYLSDRDYIMRMLYKNCY